MGNINQIVLTKPNVTKWLLPEVVKSFFNIFFLILFVLIVVFLSLFLSFFLFHFSFFLFYQTWVNIFSSSKPLNFQLTVSTWHPIKRQLNNKQRLNQHFDSVFHSYSNVFYRCLIIIKQENLSPLPQYYRQQTVVFLRQ